jgi:hypothetical protein
MVLRRSCLQGPRLAATAAFAMFGMSIVARAQQPTPAAADENLTLRDHHFKLSAPVPSGRSTWHVRNEGTEPHQALIVQLPEGVHEYAERTWFISGSRGEEPNNATWLMADGLWLNFGVNPNVQPFSHSAIEPFSHSPSAMTTRH